MPEVDTWASDAMHVLPRFVTNFWRDVPLLPVGTVIWANPRFSQMQRVLTFWTAENCIGFILYPHWVETSWWQEITALATRTYDVPSGTLAFLNHNQVSPRPCPWPFHIAFINCLTPPANSTATGLPPEGGRTPVGRSRRGRAKRARLVRLAYVRTYPPQMGYCCVPPSSSKAHPPTRPVDLPLGAVAPPLSLRVLLQIAQNNGYPHLHLLEHMYLCLQDGKAFQRLFTEVPSPSHGCPSRLTPSRLKEATDFHILTSMPKSRPIYQFHSCFLVAKSDGIHSRFISNVGFNDKQPVSTNDDPKWTTPLLDYRTLIHTVLQWQWASDFDAQSFFFQFPLGITVQPYFGVRQKGFRGVMLCMPQGWLRAPPIAQHSASALVHHFPPPTHLPRDPTAGGLAWIDNFILGARSFEGAKHIITEFLSRCHNACVTLKEADPTPRQHLTVLGMDFDLTMGRYRFDPKWAHSASQFMIFFLQAIRHGQQATLRTIWQAIGTALWVSHIHQLPLGSHLWHVISYMKRHSPKVQSRHVWEELRSMPLGPIDELSKIIHRIRNNPWLGSPALQPNIRELRCWSRYHFVCTDASLWAGAYLFASTPPYPVRGQWWQWSAKACDNWMPILEALAFLRALQETSTFITKTIIWLTDCEPVRLAFVKQYSPSVKLNAILLAIRTLLSALNVNVIACWIPTAINPADDFSRRRDFVPPMTFINMFLPDGRLWHILSSPLYTGGASKAITALANNAAGAA